MIKLDLNKSWTFKHKGLYCKISHWGVERANNFESLNDGKGIWNYYVTLPEHILGDKFAAVWLEDKKIQFSVNSPERITHDYYGHPFSEVDWHGGITYYAKHGQLEGHRSVELGCDYSHLYDMERGYDYTLDDVYADCCRTAEELAAIYLTKEQQKL